MHGCDLASILTDLFDTAVVLANVDAVVTTDSVVANLSALMGRTTFVLVPKTTDWRWSEGARAVWYPSARVYQQAVLGEWGDPIARLTHDLGTYLKEHGGRR